MLPNKVRRSLVKFGADLTIARKKRHLTLAMMAEGVGVAISTYRRVERGDPTVALGVYAMAMFVLGFGGLLGDVLDVSKDDQGLLLDTERLPKRIRMRKEGGACEADDSRVPQRPQKLRDGSLYDHAWKVTVGGRSERFEGPQVSRSLM